MAEREAMPDPAADAAPDNEADDNLLGNFPTEFDEERVSEWIELLKHEKTAATAVSCLVYIGNALASAGISPFRARIGKNKFNSENTEQARSYLHGSTVIMNGTTKIFIVSVSEENCSSVIGRYRAQFVSFINSYTPEPETKWIDVVIAVGKKLDPVEKVSRFLFPREEQPLWSNIQRSESTAQSIKSLTGLLVNGDFEACTSEIAQLLLNAIVSIGHGYHINNSSPLHEATKAQDLDALIMLLSHGVDVNSVDEEGFTAFFYTLHRDYPLIAKTLIVFGADLNLIRTEDFTQKISIDFATKISMDYANRVEYSSEILEIIANVTTASETAEKVLDDEAKKLLRPLSEQGEKTHLLSLDGGGIRGLVLTTILAELDREIPGFLDRIKWSAGTSTGAILSLALAHGKTIGECRNIYFKVRSGKKLMATSVDKSGVIFQDVLFKSYKVHDDYTIKDNYQPEQYLDESLTEGKMRKSRNVDAPPPNQQRMQGPDHNSTAVAVWEAARCSSAAPTIFKSRFQYLDGGITCNNPTQKLLHEWIKYNEAIEARMKEWGEDDEGEQTMKLGAVLSIGTGRKKNDARAPSSVSLPWTRETTELYDFGTMMKEEIAKSDGDVVTMSQKLTETYKGAFFRFTPEFEGNLTELNETDNATLIEMMWKTKMYMREQRQYINLLGKVLNNGA